MYTNENTRQEWTNSAARYPTGMAGLHQTLDRHPVYPQENAPNTCNQLPSNTSQPELGVTEQNKIPFVFLKDTDLRYLKKTLRVGLVICTGILVAYLIFYTHGIYTRTNGCKFYTTQKLVQYVVGTVNSTSDGYGNLHSQLS